MKTIAVSSGSLSPGWIRLCLRQMARLALFCWLGLCTAQSTAVPSKAPDSAGADGRPVATGSREVASNPIKKYRCVVLLQTRANRLYCYATNMPFRVYLREPGWFALGEEFEAEGELLPRGDIEDIPTLSDSTVHRLGITNVPPPIPVTPSDMIVDGMNFRRVAIRGRVEAHQWMRFMDHHLEVIVAKGKDGNFRVNVLEYSDAANRFPPGAEVEFVGLSFVETFVPQRGPEAQMDMLNLDECRLLKSPPWITPEWARRLPAIGLGVLLLGALWVTHERRQVLRLRAAERAVRELNTDLEHRIQDRTAELQAANERLRQAEQDLLRTLAAEKELSQLKTRFVSMVSHELRNPLGVVMCSTEVLKNYLDSLSEADREGHLDAILTSSRRMSSLMEEVLFLGKADAGRIQCTREPVDLPTLCRRVVSETALAPVASHRVALVFGEGLEGAMGDESLIRHILSNLVSNALKYSPADTPVEVVVERVGGAGRIRVTDHGIGIPARDQARIFDGFFRGTNVGSVGGFGIGLSIVRRCVEVHGGQIQFESVEGRGTRFEVELPLYRKSSETELLARPIILSAPAPALPVANAQ